ncbi:MAG: metallophosphoesterase [Kiritimatiellae bacterium]|nr:metallophosphoesterase [Kiritimatiellia bacterium]
MTRRGFILSASSFALCGSTSIQKVLMSHDKSLSVFISDTHISPRADYNYTYKALERIVDEVLLMRPLPARVVVFGDISIAKGMRPDYKKAKPLFQRLVGAGIDVHYTMGNHDRRSSFLATFPEAEKRMLVKDRFLSVVDLGSIDLILLDSLCQADGPEGTPNTPAGTIDRAQWDWLNENAPKWKRPFVCGAHHAPHDLSIEIDGVKKDVLVTLKECDNYVGWVQGHNHRWDKRFNIKNSKSKSATFRWLVLPSTGYWGDIGYVVARSYPDRLDVSLELKDFYYDRPLEKNKRPKCWDDIVEDKKGDYCRFSFPGTI